MFVTLSLPGAGPDKKNLVAWRCTGVVVGGMYAGGRTRAVRYAFLHQVSAAYVYQSDIYTTFVIESNTVVDTALRSS